MPRSQTGGQKSHIFLGLGTSRVPEGGIGKSVSEATRENGDPRNTRRNPDEFLSFGQGQIKGATE